jgi:hypothetical protein
MIGEFQGYGMTRYALMFAMVAALSTPSSAQQGWDKPDPAFTTVPTDVGFELVHNPRTAETFRLNKSGGQVWILRRISSIGTETWVWRAIQPPDDMAAQPRSNAVNYQVFVSPAGTTLLLNVYTGATWMLRTVSGELRWLTVTLERS